MQHSQANIFLGRNDTFLGVCEALGEDFGFHANYLRVALALMLFFAPVAVIGGYAAAGVIVGLSRWIAPNPAFADASAGAPMPGQAPRAGDNDADAEKLAA